jgi:hypothetical protein
MLLDTADLAAADNVTLIAEARHDGDALSRELAERLDTAEMSASDDAVRIAALMALVDEIRHERDEAEAQRDAAIAVRTADAADELAGYADFYYGPAALAAQRERKTMAALDELRAGGLL